MEPIDFPSLSAQELEKHPCVISQELRKHQLRIAHQQVHMERQQLQIERLQYKLELQGQELEILKKENDSVKECNGGHVRLQELQEELQAVTNQLLELKDKKKDASNVQAVQMVSDKMERKKVEVRLQKELVTGVKQATQPPPAPKSKSHSLVFALPVLIVVLWKPTAFVFDYVLQVVLLDYLPYFEYVCLVIMCFVLMYFVFMLFFFVCLWLRSLRFKTQIST